MKVHIFDPLRAELACGWSAGILMLGATETQAENMAGITADTFRNGMN